MLAWNAEMKTAKDQPVETAPRDGQRIEVFLAGEGVWAVARWAQETQAWVRADDPDLYTLRRVTRWRPVKSP